MGSNRNSREEATYPMQVPNDLIQSWSERTIHVKKQPIGLFKGQYLTQMRDNGLELLCSADPANLGFQLRRGPDRFEAHEDLLLLESPGRRQRRACVARQSREDRRCRHGERQLR